MPNVTTSIASLTLLVGCTLGADVEKPGLYECVPTNPVFADLEPIRYDSRFADARVALPCSDAVTFTSIEGKRLELRVDDPARWRCSLIVDYEAEKAAQ